MQKRGDAQPSEVAVDVFEQAKEQRRRHGMKMPWMAIMAPATSRLW